MCHSTFDAESLNAIQVPSDHRVVRRTLFFRQRINPEARYTMSDNISDTELKNALNLSAVSLLRYWNNRVMKQQLPKHVNCSRIATSEQMEEIKPHLTSLAREFMILAGFYKD
jgi:hypothetical protein